LDVLAVEKTNLENENTYLRAILSWVSPSEPQLAMMIKQFKRGVGFGVGYTYTKSDFDKLYGKIGKAVVVSSALNTASTSTQPSLVDPMDGVLKEPSKAHPQKQVWVPKPNELRNPLDTLPAAAAQVAPKKGAAPPRPKAGSPPPKREVRYHYEFCDRDGHLEEFCFRRKRDVRRELERRNSDMYSAQVYFPPRRGGRKNARARRVSGGQGDGGGYRAPAGDRFAGRAPGRPQYGYGP